MNTKIFNPTHELTQKIISNKGVNQLIKLLKSKNVFDPSYSLIGGAIVDILEGRVPKDYDVVGDLDSSTIEVLISAGFKFQYETSTSVTFECRGIKLQFLKTKIEDFDFTVSQTEFFFNDLQLLFRDYSSFQNKTLTPVNFKNPINSLMRLPHWEKKGYKMHEYTYYSLLNSIQPNNINNNINNFSIKS